MIGIRSGEGARIVLAAWLISTIVQAVGAFLLTRSAVRGFNAAVGRPIAPALPGDGWPLQSATVSKIIRHQDRRADASRPAPEQRRFSCLDHRQAPHRDRWILGGLCRRHRACRSVCVGPRNDPNWIVGAAIEVAAGQQPSYVKGAIRSSSYSSA